MKADVLFAVEFVVPTPDLCLACCEPGLAKRTQPLGAHGAVPDRVQNLTARPIERQQLDNRLGDELSGAGNKQLPTRGLRRPRDTPWSPLHSQLRSRIGLEGLILRQ